MELTLEDRSCPICRLNQSRPKYESNVTAAKLDGFAFASRKLPEYMHHRLVECLACKLLYASPAPAAASLGELYHTADYDSQVESRYAAATYAAALPTIMARLPDLDGALDVGTGSGEFLESLLDAGFTDVQGVEPSKKPVEMARPRVKNLIALDIFRPESYPAKSLSLITCFQTLEHLADPAGFCSNAYSLLKPGGAAYVVVHNRKALSARILGARSPIFDLEHLQLFCPDSLRRMFQKAGFREVVVERVWNAYPIRYWLKLCPFPNLIKRLLTTVAEFSGLGRLVVKIPAGNIAVAAYK